MDASKVLEKTKSIFFSKIEKSLQSLMDSGEAYVNDLHEMERNSGITLERWFEFWPNKDYTLARRATTKFRMIDYLHYSLAEVLGDVRNLSLEEKQFLEFFEKEIKGQYDYDTWDEILKAIKARQIELGKIKTGSQGISGGKQKFKT